MRIRKIIKFIINQPLTRNHKTKTIIRFLHWQFTSRLFPGKTKVFEFTNKTKLLLKKGMAGASGNYYCGLQDFTDMGFLLHFLRAEDHFMDIGANIGSYTVLASGHIGCKTICAEPVPSTFLILKENVALNKIEDKVNMLNIAVGSEKGNLYITSQYDTINNIKLKEETGTITVPVDCLDNIYNSENEILLLKIDVEGFEAAVLEGGKKIISNRMLKAIIVELNGLGNQYGYDEEKLHELLVREGFEVCQYDPLTRILTRCNETGINNSIYIRDFSFVQHRLTNAAKIKVLNQWI